MRESQVLKSMKTRTRMSLKRKMMKTSSSMRITKLFYSMLGETKMRSA